MPLSQRCWPCPDQACRSALGCPRVTRSGMDERNGVLCGDHLVPIACHRVMVVADIWQEGRAKFEKSQSGPAQSCDAGSGMLHCFQIIVRPVEVGPGKEKTAAWSSRLRRGGAGGGGGAQLQCGGARGGAPLGAGPPLRRGVLPRDGLLRGPLLAGAAPASRVGCLPPRRSASTPRGRTLTAPPPCSCWVRAGLPLPVTLSLIDLAASIRHNRCSMQPLNAGRAEQCSAAGQWRCGQLESVRCREIAMVQVHCEMGTAHAACRRPHTLDMGATGTFGQHDCPRSVKGVCE